MASSWDKGSYASDLSGSRGLSRSQSTPVLRKALATSITPSQLQRIHRLTREFTESGRSQASSVSAGRAARKDHGRAHIAAIKAHDAEKLRQAEAKDEVEDPAVMDIYASAGMARVARMAYERESEIRRLDSQLVMARCLSERERHKEHLAKQRAERARYADALDRQMERDRVAELRAREVAAVEAQAERHRCQAELKAQIAQRQMAKIIRDEARYVEGQQMKAQNKRQLELDAEARRALERKKKANMEGVLDSNKMQIEMKARRVEEDRLDDLRVAAFVRAKERREEAVEEARRAAARQKELLWKKQVESQERVLDMRGDIDAENAKRHREALDKKQRARAAREAAARVKLRRDMCDTLAWQQEQKQLIAERERKEDFERKRLEAQWFQKEDAKLAREAEVKRRQNDHFKECLWQQAAEEREAKEYARRRKKVDDRKALNRKRRFDRYKIDQIRAEREEKIVAAMHPNIMARLEKGSSGPEETKDRVLAFLGGAHASTKIW